MKTEVVKEFKDFRKWLYFFEKRGFKFVELEDDNFFGFDTRSDDPYSIRNFIIAGGVVVPYPLDLSFCHKSKSFDIVLQKYSDSIPLSSKITICEFIAAQNDNGADIIAVGRESKELISEVHNVPVHTMGVLDSAHISQGGKWTYKSYKVYGDGEEKVFQV